MDYFPRGGNFDKKNRAGTSPSEVPALLRK